jgi:hypothetical protein
MACSIPFGSVAAGARSAFVRDRVDPRLEKIDRTVQFNLDMRHALRYVNGY